MQLGEFSFLCGVASMGWFLNVQKEVLPGGAVWLPVRLARPPKAPKPRWSPDPLRAPDRWRPESESTGWRG